MRKPYTLLFVLSIFVTFSCNDDISCEDFDWLDSEIQTLEQSGLSHFFYVSQAEYKGMTVYIFKDCCPNCSSLPPRIVNCLGGLIGRLGEDIDASKLKNEMIYWQPDNFACSIN